MRRAVRVCAIVVVGRGACWLAKDFLARAAPVLDGKAHKGQGGRAPGPIQIELEKPSLGGSKELSRPIS